MNAYCQLKKVNTSYEITQLLPYLQRENQQAEVNCFIQHVMDSAKKHLAYIYQITAQDRTIENTLLAYDYVRGDCAYALATLRLLELVGDEETKRFLLKSIDILQNFYIQQFRYNTLYADIFKTFIETLDKHQLSPELQYYIFKEKAAYEKNGMWLDQTVRSKLVSLQKSIMHIEQEFESHIAKDASKIFVEHEQLSGLSEQFITNLPQTADGRYQLGVDYPTYTSVMQYAKDSSVRQALFTAFHNRGYPANVQVLKNLIEQRTQLARLLGYENYAAFVMQDQMAQTVDTVDAFLQNIFVRAQAKADQEFAMFQQCVTDNTVAVTNEGKVQPWEFAYLSAQYKTKYLDLNEQEICAYFPLEHVLNKASEIIGRSFNVRIEISSIDGLWVDQLPVLTVYQNNNTVLGFIILDLFPRTGKYSHACQETFIPAVKNFYGEDIPAVTAVIANFTPPANKMPALLTRIEVNTLFHELGHALHAIFGATDYISQSGTSVKLDFVETPSQVMEEWLWNPTVLKELSCHYLTHASLPDAMIAALLQLKHFESGLWIQRQVFLAKFSLEVYRQPARDIDELFRDLYKAYRPHIMPYADDHFYTSFVHLGGYSALYYSYLWSKIIALDIIDILTSSETLPISQAGQAVPYKQNILARGGSREPATLLCTFLGRPTNPDAFFKDMGIEKDMI